MNTSTIFYYDESFHDRRLSTKDGMLNAYLDNSHDGFLFSLLGGDGKTIQSFLEEYEKLEEVTKESLGLTGELKSTTFSKKNFDHGIASFNRDCKTFYFGFFELLMKYNILFQVGFISKTEMLVRRYLEHARFPFSLPYKSFVYSFTKLLEEHRLESLFDNLLKNSERSIRAFTSKVIDLLETLYISVNGIEREKIESIVISKIIAILELGDYEDGVTIDDSWNYQIIADGVKNRLNETNSECTVFLDNEQSTYDAFINAGINCEQLDSKRSAGIRSVDMFVGFVGRMIKSFKNDIKEPPLRNINDIKRELYLNKRLISNEWFEIDEETFQLYKKIGAYFSSATYWSSFVTCYCDDTIMFFSLFNYINIYETYNSFLKNKGTHNEYYNSYVCQQIYDLYPEEMDSKSY